jgi:Uma2 family endonuclease
VSQRRWDNTPDDDNLMGSPELVIEVLSPTNTRAEMREKAGLCLSTGTTVKTTGSRSQYLAAMPKSKLR